MSSLQKSLLAGAALLALMAAGCGTSGSKTDSTDTTAQKTSTNKKKSSSADKSKKDVDPRACGKLGITPETTKEGTCNQGKGANKHSITIVNGDSTLKLKELDIKVSKVSTADSVAGPAGTIKAKSGGKDKKGKPIPPTTFVIVDLAWKNKDGKSQKLNDNGQQIKLRTAGGGGKTFQPAEKADADSLYNAKSVKENGKQKAKAIFQIPQKAADGIKTRGAAPQLLVWEFSTAGKEKEPANGAIRLWNL
jgi:hypothetical protein